MIASGWHPFEHLTYFTAFLDLEHGRIYQFGRENVGAPGPVRTKFRVFRQDCVIGRLEL